MAEFFDAFGISVTALLAQVANFLLILYLLNRFLFTRVRAQLDERSARIAKGLEDAEVAARDRELARAEREQALGEARTEAADILSRATKMAEETRNDILREAREEAERVATRSREEIAAEQQRAMAQIRGEVAEIALAAAGKLMRREMDSPTQRRLVEEFLTEVKPGRTRTREARN